MDYYFSSITKLDLKTKQECAKEYAEGDSSLENLLLYLWANGIDTYACCAGHKEKNWEPYIFFEISKIDKNCVVKMICEALADQNLTNFCLSKSNIGFSNFERQTLKFQGVDFAVIQQIFERNLGKNINSDEVSALLKGLDRTQQEAIQLGLKTLEIDFNRIYNHEIKEITNNKDMKIEYAQIVYRKGQMYAFWGFNLYSKERYAEKEFENILDDVLIVHNGEFSVERSPGQIKDTDMAEKLNAKYDVKSLLDVIVKSEKSAVLG